nr:oligosaccharide flippase family protein [Oenococcus oeni]
MISELGVGPAIIQNHDLDDLDLSSLFKMLTVVSLLIGCFLVFWFWSLLVLWKDNLHSYCLAIEH